MDGTIAKHVIGNERGKRSVPGLLLCPSMDARTSANSSSIMRLTLLQMMKLVVGCALASAYVLPLVRLAEAGIVTWSATLVVGAISIPLVFTLVTIVLAKKGPRKDWLIRVLSLTSVGVPLGVVAYAFATAVATWIRRGVPFDLHSLASLSVLGLLVIVFGLIFTRLLWGMEIGAADRVQGETMSRPGPRASCRATLK